MEGRRKEWEGKEKVKMKKEEVEGKRKKRLIGFVSLFF